MLLHDIIYLRWLFHGNDFYFAGTTFISWERFLILGHELKNYLKHMSYGSHRSTSKEQHDKNKCTLYFQTSNHYYTKYIKKLISI